jgi:protein-S-isoprenylcysteine O-methyltransferase Ste14
LATLLYAIGFVGNFVVPKTIDSGAAGSIGTALAVNAALLSLFVLQHTVMARPAFKRWFTRFVPASIERSTFVLCTVAIFALLFSQWRPIPDVVWSVTNPLAAGALTALSLIGYGIVVASSFMVNHFDLFGLRQVWFGFANRAYHAVGFRIVGLYRWVRHPLMLGFLIAFWSTPTMTVGHLFFAVMVTAYIRFGTWMEERDLVAEHGLRYLRYQSRVSFLLPLPRAKRDLIVTGELDRAS